MDIFGDCCEILAESLAVFNLSVTATVGSNIAEYVEIAVRLGLPPKMREGITPHMLQGHSALYEDKTAVAALEDFYRRAVEFVRSCHTGGV